MRSIPPLMGFAGAVIVFAAGYAQGAASSITNPFLNTKSATTSGLTFVEGPDAEPPPWPSNLPAARPVVAASTSVPAPETRSNSPPADTERVAPADRSDVLALNIPSSALNPVSNPPPAPAPVAETYPLPTAETDAVPLEVQKVRPRRLQPLVPKQVTFGTTRGGQPVTIIWDH